MLYCFFAMYLMKLERMINGFLSGKVQGCNLGPAGFRCPKTLGVCYRGGDDERDWPARRGFVVLFEESCAYCLPLSVTIPLQSCDLVPRPGPSQQTLDVGGDVGGQRSRRSRKGWSAQLALTHVHFR